MTIRTQDASFGLPPGASEALDAFISLWMNRPDVLGGLLVGSYACELGNSFSDLDFYFILADSVTERQRGDHLLGGLVFEYNADPIRYIRELQKQQFVARNRHCARKIASGKMLFSHDDVVPKLQEEARVIMRTPFAPQEPTITQMSIYYMWDQIDNL